jgi:hypothetical protein
MTVGLMKISFIKNHDNLSTDFMYVAQNGPFNMTQQPSSTPKNKCKEQPCASRPLLFTPMKRVV